MLFHKCNSNAPFYFHELFEYAFPKLTLVQRICCTHCKNILSSLHEEPQSFCHPIGNLNLFWFYGQLLCAFSKHSFVPWTCPKWRSWNSQCVHHVQMLSQNPLLYLAVVYKCHTSLSSLVHDLLQPDSLDQDWCLDQASPLYWDFLLQRPFQNS